jgi:hypothetical protein
MTTAALLVLLFAALLFAGVVALLPPDRIDPPYKPRHSAIAARRQPGATLDPLTLALPPIEASPLTDVDLHRVIAALSTSDNLPVLAERPTGASGKRHDLDWRFRTDEWEIARASFFEGQPQDQAITRPWAGVGR